MAKPEQNAIQADVFEGGDDEGQPDDTPVPNPVDGMSRDEAEAAIDQKRMEELESEGVDLSLMRPEDEADDVEPSPDDKETDQGDETPSIEEPTGDNELPVYLKDGVPMTRVKVNGVEEEIPYANVLARYQKDSAGDIKLQQAAERERELDEREMELQRREAEQTARNHFLSNRDDGGAPSNVDAQATDEDNLVSQYHDALLSGDEEEANKLLLQINHSRTSQGATPVNVDDIVQRAKAEVREELQQESRETERQKALKRFKREYSDIMSDVRLKNVADARSLELYDENDPTQDFWEIMKQAGDETREWMKSLSGSEDGTEVDAPDKGGNGKNVDVKLEDRGKRKSVIDDVVPAGTTASIGEGADDAPQSYSEIIAEERAARGQPN